MADIEHRDIPDADLHECKGFSAAPANQVRVSDGAGGGSLVTLGNFQQETLTAYFNDVSTASSQWIVCPFAGDIVKIYTVIDTAITVANAVMSFELAGVPVTNGGITIAFSGAAAGDVDSSTPTAANTVAAGQAIEIISDGGSTTASNARVTFVIDVSP